MLLEVSIGEAIDKLNILELKLKKITDEDKKIEIKKEIDSLVECNNYKNNNEYYYRLLNYVNEQIWELTDMIKVLNIENEEYAKLSYKIFDFNQQRYRLKSFFNALNNSNIKEQKSYKTMICKIIIESEEEFYDKIPEINYISINYDNIILDIKYTPRYNIKSVIYSPNIIEDNSTLSYANIIELKDFKITDDIRSIFEYPYINYIGAGKFGDFLQSLSVANEKFYMTGRKANVYIHEGNYNNEMYEQFSTNGIMNTYNDTYEVIISQKYINSYNIYKNEKIEIDLFLGWRTNTNMFKRNWYHIFSNAYNIEWGKTEWLSVHKNETFQDKVLINIVPYRNSINIDFNYIYSKFGDSLLFISPSEQHYLDFKTKTGININFYHTKTFTELCVAISSCKLLIASLSGILTIGHALNVPRMIVLCDLIDNIHNTELEKNFQNVIYSI